MSRSKYIHTKTVDQLTGFVTLAPIDSAKLGSMSVIINGGRSLCTLGKVQAADNMPFGLNIV